MVGDPRGVFDTVLGLPVHPLVVHAVVVLVPLAALGVVVMALSRTWFDRLRWPVLAVLTVGLGSAFVAKESGEAFLARLQVQGDAIDRHVDLGDECGPPSSSGCSGCSPWPGCLYVAARAGRPRSGQLPTSVRVLAALSVVAGLLVTADIVLVGHSGATAVWRGVVEATDGSAS